MIPKLRLDRNIRVPQHPEEELFKEILEDIDSLKKKVEDLQSKVSDSST